MHEIGGKYHIHRIREKQDFLYCHIMLSYWAKIWTNLGPCRTVHVKLHACILSLNAVSALPNEAYKTCDLDFQFYTHASECATSKTRIPPTFFSPWLVKYGSESGFSLSNSVITLQSSAFVYQLLVPFFVIF